jgi:proteasome assembly chaperone (PAC2) family protein
MFGESMHFEEFPALHDPLFIAGFEGWGNALDVSRGAAAYLIRKTDAKRVAKINPDYYYRFDENRPLVNIKDGIMLDLSPPGGAFYAKHSATGERDLLLFQGTEPGLAWHHFTESLLSLCQRLGAKTIVSLGGMYDAVLHTDFAISALASNKEVLEELKNLGALTIDYSGPSAIHSTIVMEARKRGFTCVSLWGHCPQYLQGATHYGMIAHLCDLIASWGGFTVDTTELSSTWKNVSVQIQKAIDENPELQEMIAKLRKTKIRGVWNGAGSHEKIIHLKDFIGPK